MKMYRQGDVWIEQVTSIPKNAKKKSNRILAEGEATGHHHSVTVDVMEHEDDMFFEGPTKLTHQEHAPIEIPEGTYKSYIQQEYSPEEIKRVVD